MEKNINILIVADSFNYNCGVSKHLYYLIKQLPPDINTYLLIPDGTAIELLKSIRVKYLIEPSLSYQKRNILNLLKAIFSIYRCSKKLNIDIIHSHNYYAANASGIVGNLTNIKTVQTIHSYFKREGILKKYFADYYILVNEILYDKAKEEEEFNEHRMKVIHNGVDSNYINKVRIADIKNGKMNLLAASRLIYQKGVQTVIEALSLLSIEDREKINFQIAGTGDYKPKLEKYAAEKEVGVTFLGEVSDMNSLFLSCDIFVFSSYDDSLPIALLEAGSYECFIITSDFNGILPIFRHGLDGFIYEKYSAKQLADAIIRALKLDDERQKYIDSFKTILTERFTSGIMAGNTYKYYMEIIK